MGHLGPGSRPRRRVRRDGRDRPRRARRPRLPRGATRRPASSRAACTSRAYALGIGASGMTFLDSEIEALLGEPLEALLFTCVGVPSYRSKGGGRPGEPVRSSRRPPAHGAQPSAERASLPRSFPGSSSPPARPIGEACHRTHGSRGPLRRRSPRSSSPGSRSSIAPSRSSPSSCSPRRATPTRAAPPSSVLVQAIADIGLPRLAGNAPRARRRHARLPARRPAAAARARARRARGRRPTGPPTTRC